MELMILAYIASILTWIFFEIFNIKSSLNLYQLTQSVRVIEIQIKNIEPLKKEVQDLNNRFKQRGF